MADLHDSGRADSFAKFLAEAVRLHRAGAWAAAEAAYMQAIRSNPNHVGAINDYGTLLAAMGRYREAIARYDQAIAVQPDFAEAYWNKSLAQLVLGNLVEGFANYQWLWKRNLFASAIPTLKAPLWSGREPVAGKRVLLYSEQGFGDTIQFFRYVPMVEARGARVEVAVKPPLRELFGLALGRKVWSGEKMPAPDFQCPFGRLPFAFRTDIDTIPAPIPYLKAPARPELSRRLPAGAFCVGLVWAGLPTHPDDARRSIGLRALLPLLALANIQFVSLQKDPRPEDVSELGRWPNCQHLGPALDTFSETAAIVARLDLVIAVDSAVAHLALALGKPTWVLLPFVPDWRWLLDREDSPWYPTARLFRQPRPGDWDSVVARVAAELTACAAARSVRADSGR